LTPQGPAHTTIRCAKGGVAFYNQQKLTWAPAADGGDRIEGIASWGKEYKMTFNDDLTSGKICRSRGLPAIQNPKANAGERSTEQRARQQTGRDNLCWIIAFSPFARGAAPRRSFTIS
jgi:hypothetical protein